MAKPNIIMVPATIAAQTSISSIVDLTAGNVVGIVMPTQNWTPAVVTLQGSPDGINFYDIHDGLAGKELSFNADLGSLVMVDWDRMRSCKKVILRSGTHDNPVNQALTCQFNVVIEIIV